MNLLGPELVRDLVSLIQRAEADEAFQVLVFGEVVGREVIRPLKPGAWDPLPRTRDAAERIIGRSRGYC